jgi:hypothetical protein
MRTWLIRHGVAIAIALLYLLTAAGIFRQSMTVDELRREANRSARTDCELDQRTNERIVEFAGLIADILEDAGPETEGGRRLVADLRQRALHLFPTSADCR